MTNRRPDVQSAAEKLLTRFLNIRSGETLWLFTDLPPTDLGRTVISSTADALGFSCRWVELPPLQENGQELPPSLTSVRSEGTPVVSYTSLSLSSTSFRQKVCRDGGRFYSLPGGLPALLLLDLTDEDWATMQRRGERIQRMLGSAASVTCLWHDAVLEIPLADRKPRLDLGICHHPGSFASPSFEVNTVPLEYATEGTLRAKGVLPALPPFRQSVDINVRGGTLKSQSSGGNEDTHLWQQFAVAAPTSMLRVAELGFGLNHTLTFPASTYVASESVWGTVHIGIGRNLTLGGTFEAPGHLDVVLQPEKVVIGEAELFGSVDKVEIL